MNSTSAVRLVESQALGGKRCSGCGRTKPTTAFYRHHRAPDGLQWHCVRCQSASKARRAADGLNVVQARRRRERPGVREREREWERAYNLSPRGRAVRLAYRESVIGRLVGCRKSARYRLKQIPSDQAGRRRCYEDMIAEYTREIERLRTLRGS